MSLLNQAKGQSDNKNATLYHTMLLCYCFNSGIIVLLYNPLCMTSFLWEEKVRGNKNNTDFLCSYQCHIITLCVMQLSVTQTITSTENNYKAHVNFTGGTVLRLQACFRANHKQHTEKSKQEMKASSLTPWKTKGLKRSYKHSLQR